VYAQHKVKAFKGGEWLKYKISYSNFVSAGNATMQIKEIKENGVDAYHVEGQGKTTGLMSWFFKVEDNYQTYLNKQTLLPFKFIRKIEEGGYTKNKEILFDQSSKNALVKDHKHKTEEMYSLDENVHDMLSGLYCLRNEDLSKINKGDEFKLNLFFDQSSYLFKMHFLGKDIIRTKFGKIATLKFRPFVQAGRVFKEEESLTVWISDDENKIPIRIKASLAVGSMRIDLIGFKGLANPFPIIFN
jgi:hypothetical protein